MKKVWIAERPIDGNGVESLGHVAVSIDGQRVTSVGPFDSLKLPEGAPVLDYGKVTLIRNLIDAHTHLCAYSSQAPVKFLK